MSKSRSPQNHSRILFKKNSAGFTIIELLIATTVFAMILVLISVAMIQIGRTYIKGITESRTQEVARSALDDISQSIQFSGATVRIIPDYDHIHKGFCIDNKRYSYVLGKQLEDNPATTGPSAGSQSKHVLVVDDIDSCPGPTGHPLEVDNPSEHFPDSSKELMGEHMRLNADILQGSINSNTRLFNLTMNVIYGDNDVLNSSRTGCKGNNAGGQFCAVSILNTTVEKRVQ